MKEKNEVLKKKIKTRTEANQKVENSKSQRNVEKDLMQWKKKCDEMKAKTQKKRQQLNSLSDRLNEANIVQSDLNNDDNPQMKQIRLVGNRLDKIMIKYNEALDVTKTYQLIKSKLEEDRLHYENLLTAIEKNLSDKNVDMNELISLSSQAKSERDNMENKLKRIQNNPG